MCNIFPSIIINFFAKKYFFDEIYLPNSLNFIFHIFFQKQFCEIIFGFSNALELMRNSMLSVSTMAGPNNKCQTSIAKFCKNKIPEFQVVSEVMYFFSIAFNTEAETWTKQIFSDASRTREQALPNYSTNICLFSFFLPIAQYNLFT